MSAIDPVAPGATLLHYRLGDRIGSTVWSAEDTRSGKMVAVKILTRQLPKDASRREPLIRDVRQAAALYHSFLVNILEIVDSGDVLLMAMELVDAQPLSRYAKSKAVDRTEFFLIAYQLVDVVKFLHLRELTHLNITGDSVMITASGQVRLGGLNVNNLLKRDAQTMFQQRAGDTRSVAYMPPEQISGEAVTRQADIWSLGVTLYELATSKLPFTASNAAELAQRIIEGQPASPKAARPDIDPQVLSVMGRCLFKDPFKRHKDAKALLEEIIKVDPESQRVASELAKSGAVPAASQAVARDALLFIADIENYDALAAEDPSIATKASARMQQILGESVYLFDGVVVDPFGRRMVAELPTIDQAVEAARKGQFDFSPEMQEGDPLQVRMLLHAGNVTIKDGEISGEAMDRAVEVLEELPPLRLFLSEDFLKRGRGTLRLRDGGARAGMKLYNIVEPEPEPPPPPEPQETTAELADAAAQEHAAEIAAFRAKQQRKQRKMLLAVVCSLVAILGGLFVVLQRKDPEVVRPATTKRAELPPAAAATPRSVYLHIDGADPALADRATRISLATAAILATYPEVRISDKAGASVTSFTATLRNGAAGPEIVAGHDAPAPAPDDATAIDRVLRAIGTELKLPARNAAVPAVYASLADAATANAAHDSAKTDAAIRAAVKADPAFLPAQLFAMSFFDAQGKEKDAIEAAKQVFALDPNNIVAARRLAHAGLADGDIAAAFTAYAAVMKHDKADAETLNTFARYAVSADDDVKFRAALARLRNVAPAQVAAHEADVLVAAGKMSAAVDHYYEDETLAPRNAAVALKIGRISVLLHGLPIAELELKKLEDVDRAYGYHLLKAYIAAQNGAKTEAQAELKEAQVASKPGDDYWTSVAEIGAMTGDAHGVLAALENAAAKKEPTASYILSNPLFRFLENDPAFSKIRQALMADQAEIRLALGNVPL
jgi:hypothetical protein